MALVEMSLCGLTQNRAEFVAIPWPVAKLSCQKMHLPPPAGRRNDTTKGIFGTTGIEFCGSFGTAVPSKTQILASSFRSISKGDVTDAARSSELTRQRIELIRRVNPLSEPKRACGAAKHRPRQWNTPTNTSICFTRRLPMDTG
jgi:hypothetical protein